ncbi:MAG TPA: methyltransferase domain-containing protein [Dehalococcoidia bacterium]|nr:methyltransferase domain-containing protein [Dehalococcoidia bacterium]
MPRRGKPSLRDTQAQFGRQARHYAQSTLHRRGETLDTILELATVQRDERVLDVGTGAGFTAFALAPLAGRVLATDPTPEMLAEARRLAAQAGRAEAVEWALCAAESLPLADASVDLLTCRYASHHFHDLPKALREFARVLRPGARAVICDVVAPETAPIIELMNALEVKRDPTHVWNYPLSHWRNELLPKAGLQPRKVVRGKNPQLFSEWVHRAGTAAEAIPELIEMFTKAPEEARQAFAVRWDGAEIYFAWDNVVILAMRELPGTPPAAADK